MKPLLLITLLLCSYIYARNIVYIVPPCGYEHEQLFNTDDLRLNEENRSLPFVNLREAFRAIGYDLRTTTLDEHLHDFAGLIVCAVPDLKKLERVTRQHKARCIQLFFEPPTIVPHYYNPVLRNYFHTIFTLLDSMVDNRIYVKFFYPQVGLRMTQTRVPFNEKKLCTLIASNKTVHQPGEMYSQRKAAIEFFERRAPQDFDFYGHGWSNRHYRCYKGSVTWKSETLPHYKFSICIENVRLDGYITEKIFDSMIAGCVPVYWGAPNVKQFIPDTCFIDRDKFQSNQELYEFLQNMSEAEYQSYLDAIGTYLESPQAGFFSQEYFIHTMLSFFVPHYDMTTVFTPDQLTQLVRTLTL